MTKPLQEMDKKDLVKMARDMGIPVDGRAAKNDLVTVIAQALHNPPVQQEAQAPKPLPQPVFVTEDEVRAAVPKNVELEFPGDGTWIMRCKGAEDSGSLSQSLTRIKNCARWVSRGALNPPIRKENGGPMFMEGAYWDKVV